MTKQFSKEEQFNGVLNVYKRPGETPLECLERLRITRPELKDATLSYVGRLDPLASGVLLVVAGEENKNRDAYLHLPKEYAIEVLLGVSTDTHDVLGLITEHDAEYQVPDEDTIKKITSEFVGEHTLPYPVYSSKPVLGKPLFAWAKEGKADSIDIPETKLNISSIIMGPSYSVISDELHTYIQSAIAPVKGDFRQSEILEGWYRYFSETKRPFYTVLQLKVQCESGSYMRSLAVEIGKKLHIPALAYSIVRTKVGEHLISFS